MQRKLLGITSLDFRSTTHLTFCICQIIEEKQEYNEAVHLLFIFFQEVYSSVRREVLYNILIEVGIPMKVAIKMCLNETCHRVQVGKHLSNMLPNWNGVSQGDA
jgi:dTDP-4-amino-4,6-dideoxygalactose transaminase